MNDLKKMPNPATGSIFAVIGSDSTNNFEAGIRFWIITLPTGKCMIAFRLRIEKSEGLTAANMEHDCKSAYPKAKWTGGSPNHGSTAGGISTNFPPYQADNILEALEQADTGGLLYDAFTNVFVTMRFVFDRAGFNEYFMEEVAALLKGAPSETSKAVVIDFMGYQSTKNAETNEALVAEPKPILTTPLMEHEQAL